MEEKYIVAIEVGSSKIRGALACIDVTGIVNILAVQEERLVDSVRYGQVKNIEEVSNRIDLICRKLENCKAISPRKISSVYAGISGFTIGSVAETETIDFDGETEITQINLTDLKNKTIQKHFTEKDIYTLLPYEFIVDNESTLNPVGRVGRSIKATFKIIEGNTGIKSNINRVLEQRLGLEVNGHIVSAIAQAEVVLTPEEKQLGCMMVDFGAETTTVMIYKGGVLRTLVTLPMGSRNITRDLMSLNYLEDQAESYKRTIGLTPVSDGYATGSHAIDQTDEVVNCIQARVGEIIANMLAQIEYAGLKATDLPSGIILIGGGARLKGFSEMLSNQSKMKVRMGTAPRNIRISDTSMLADENIDVIALLVNAAANEPITCLTEPERQVRDVKPVDDFDDEQDNQVRIGIDDEINDNEFLDGPKRKPAKPKKPQPEPAPRTNTLFNRIRTKLSHILDDDERDMFGDNDDESEIK